MALHLHRATRTDLLADGLASVLAVPPADPFEQDLVIVPAKGVERWLTQRLSHRLGAGHGEDGVCAGIRFISPNSLVTLLLGTDHDDPWLPDHLSWPVLAAIDQHLDRPWAAQLARHLGHGDPSEAGQVRRGRRYSVARRIAGLFHSYAVQRPALLQEWEAGPADSTWSDGAGGELDPDLAWQPHLWRAVLERVPGPTPGQRHRQTVQALTRPQAPGAQRTELPARLGLFGHTRLARTELELLAALATHREVHLWLPHPSPASWERLRGPAGVGPVPREQDRSVLEVDHPLLASLGRDVRELQRSLVSAGPYDGASLPVPHAEPGSWLEWLQADVRADRTPSPAVAQRRRIDTGDGSIQVHACHGPARQVEVLREVLLALLAGDRTLEPRDILIMCPDVDTYAPLILAAFGLADIDVDGPAHPGHLLRVQLADRSRTATNPLLSVAADLVELTAGRMTAGELLDLAATEPVRRRFGFDEDDLERFAEWAHRGGIRWGLDGVHRGAFGLAGETANTWSFGLDRLLLGVARAEEPDRRYPRVLPLDDVDSGAIELVGRVSEFADRVAAFHQAVSGAHTGLEWMSALQQGVRSLTEVPFDELWQRAELDRELSLVAASGGSLPLSHSDIRSLLTTRLSGRATRANFRTGSLTVCTMIPMRSIPHRVIALLGLDEGVFPRSNTPDGDDALARRPLTGERDPRSEDRQLLLDAILAAGERLVVTYSGADTHTGVSRPPAVPLGELIDAARATAGVEEGPAPVRRHPLQAFDPRNLTTASNGAGPFSFDPIALTAATALLAGQNAATGGSEPHRDRTARRGLDIPGRLRPLSLGDVTLEELQSFYANPTRAYLRDRLDVSPPLGEHERSDGIPIQLDGLQSWEVGERLLAQCLAGSSIPDIETAERQRGALPPAGIGAAVLRELGPKAQAIATEADALLPGAFREPAHTVDVEVDLGDGRRLTGAVDRIRGRVFASTTFSSLSGKHRLEAWIALLALSAGAPTSSGPWTAHAVGRYGRSTKVASIGPVPSDIARTFLADLVELRDLGLRAPLAFTPKTSYEYAHQLHSLRGRKENLALDAAHASWERSHDNGDAAIALLYGPDAPLDIWLGAPSPEEEWEFAAEAQSLPSRFGHTAMRVWRPALLAESRR